MPFSVSGSKSTQGASPASGVISTLPPGVAVAGSSLWPESHILDTLPSANSLSFYFIFFTVFSSPDFIAVDKIVSFTGAGTSFALGTDLPRMLLGTG